jgi:UDP-galactopyranose mutase
MRQPLRRMWGAAINVAENLSQDCMFELQQRKNSCDTLLDPVCYSNLLDNFYKCCLGRLNVALSVFILEIRLWFQHISVSPERVDKAA